MIETVALGGLMSLQFMSRRCLLFYSSASGPASFASSQQMPPRWDPHHMEPVVSQVLLILIGSGMTYCQGEGDCHGPTGMGAEGI